MTPLQEYAGIQTLRFGDEETLMETLAAAKGAVSPLNLVHDNGSEKKVNLIVDSRIDQLKDGMWLCCGLVLCRFLSWTSDSSFVA
jgi:hypothetical protein